MPSATINIQSGYSCKASYGVDQTMPAIMKGRVSDTEWKLFCDQINDLLQPLNQLQRYFLFLGSLVVVGFLVVMLISVLTFGQFRFRGVSFSLFIIPLCLMVGMVIFLCHVNTKYNDCCKKIQAVCEETSRKQPLVSYHLRNDYIVRANDSRSSSSRHTDRIVYIEVSISDTPIHETNHAAYLTSSWPYNFGESNDVSSLQQTPQMRLQELEKIKHVLTTVEYDDKRAEILAAV
ncbi:hypothetical protein IV203_003826 [Nitzschia inconspicua]|uniref:Uncharacterized protein n=1 Tax=Nitzschia inconspicua TaxID=303405 RepID=A0A9K3L2H9_9STRA|nr:hypothetical protein IV203_003826 [Nitzschia inconspicua]